MVKKLKWIGLMIVASLLISCSASKWMADGGAGVDDADAVVEAQGLGKRAQFDRDKPGEFYTTKAPHNQIYLFTFDNDKLAAKYMPSIDAQAKYLKNHPGAMVMLAGHTDNRGSREYNIGLGERRAKAVYSLLRLGGAHKNQMRIVSYGKERLVSFGNDEKSHRLNRRVELIYEDIR